MEEKIIKCEITLNRIFYPKGASKIEGGQFTIFSANLVKNIEGCEKITSLKFKGKVPSLKIDTIYNVTAKLSESNEKYGDTYEIMFINSKVDLSSVDKQKQFLGTIIDETTIERLYDKYGDKVFEIIEKKDTEALTKIKGIGVKRAGRIINEFENSKDLSVIFTELNDIYLSPAMIKKLVDFYRSPDTVVDILKNNPYKIVEVDGIGFKKADEIAQKMGVSLTSPLRVRSFIIDNLRENGEMGRSFVNYQELIQSIYSNLGYLENDLINETAKLLMDKGDIHVSQNGEWIGLKRYYNMEKAIKEHLFRLLEAESLITIEDWKNIITEVENSQGFKFNEDQMEAIETSTYKNVLAITGISGAGKSATTKGVCSIHHKYNITGGALSGIAGMRLKEATELDDAGTIHRMLSYSFGGFEFNEGNTLPHHVVIIDEATMINLNLFLSVLEAIPSGAKLIILGDCEQLPPIGSGQVYYDILNSGIIPTVRLLKPNRQSAKSGIFSTSMKIINQTQMFNTQFTGSLTFGELEDMVIQVYKENDISDKVIDAFMELYNTGEELMDTQVIVPMKARGNCSTYNLNTKIQLLINPVDLQVDEFIVNNLDKDKSYKMKVGDKVINRRNNYKTLNLDGAVTPIFNGSVGIIQEIDLEEKTCTVDFLGIGEIVIQEKNWGDIELAYALTCHSTQGITVKNAITAVETGAYMLLTSNLLYTAITRAKKKSILIGQNSAIRRCISNKESSKKQTYLSYMLKGELE